MIFALQRIFENLPSCGSQEKEYFDAQYSVCAEFSSEVYWNCNERGMTIQLVTSELSHNKNYQYKTENLREGYPNDLTDIGLWYH